MKWTEITIKTTTEAVEAVTNILYEQNAMYLEQNTIAWISVNEMQYF